jgi:hypothetical protein
MAFAPEVDLGNMVSLQMGNIQVVKVWTPKGTVRWAFGFCAVWIVNKR